MSTVSLLSDLRHYIWLNYKLIWVLLSIERLTQINAATSHVNILDKQTRNSETHWGRLPLQWPFAKLIGKSKALGQFWATFHCACACTNPLHSKIRLRLQHNVLTQRTFLHTKSRTHTFWRSDFRRHTGVKAYCKLATGIQTSKLTRPKTRPGGRGNDVSR